jgi:hypothetical protein
MTMQRTSDGSLTWWIYRWTPNDVSCSWNRLREAVQQLRSASPLNAECWYNTSWPLHDVFRQNATLWHMTSYCLPEKLYWYVSTWEDIPSYVNLSAVISQHVSTYIPDFNYTCHACKNRERFVETVTLPMEVTKICRLGLSWPIHAASVQHLYIE